MSKQNVENLEDLKKRLDELDTSGPRVKDATTRLAYAYQYTCAALKNHYPFHVHGLRKELGQLSSELEEKLEALGAAGRPENNFELPCVSLDIALNGGLEAVLTKPVPFVIAKGAVDSEAVKTWSPQFFAEKYGDYQLPLAKGNIQDAQGTIRQVIADIESGEERGHYIHNVANFFNENRYLEDQLPIKSLLERIPDSRHFGCQLFLGGPKTGTSWHNASGWNFFFEVYGDKKWFMSHPLTSPWMYARMHPSGSVGLAPMDHNTPASEQSDYPLYRHVPVYESVLNAGDVLVVPPWWWHAITNISPATIAVSTRWVSPRAGETLPEFRLTQGLMPSFQEFEKEAIEEDFRIQDKYVRHTYDNAGFKSDVQ